MIESGVEISSLERSIKQYMKPTLVVFFVRQVAARIAAGVRPKLSRHHRSQDSHGGDLMNRSPPV